MKYLGYIITIIFLRLLAILPRPVLYFLSDINGFLLQHIIGYRKKVVTTNLKNSFPEWSNKEINKCRKKFYRHLSDVILENAVIQFYGRRSLEKMFSFDNPDILHKYYQEGRHIILITAHYNNWEWASPLSYTFNYRVLGIYKPLRNPFFEKEFIKARTRFGAEAVPMAQIARTLFEHNKNGVLTLSGMVADQRPIRKHAKYWTNFLNQKTAIFLGSEKMAKKFDTVVVFMKIRKPKRGIYKAEIELITENPNKTAEYEITKKHTHILEQLIMEEPAYWLWSHKRWKVSYETWLSEQKQ